MYSTKYRVYQRNYKRMMQRWKHQRNCWGCGDKFTPHRKGQYFCSPKCSRNNYFISCNKNEAKKKIKYRNDPAWKERKLSSVRKIYRDLRTEFLSAYGGRCTCCGETEIAFLTMEHKNHDGKQHRQGGTATYHAYSDLKKRGWPKEGITILCMNCNFAERHGGKCPHKLK